MVHKARTTSHQFPASYPLLTAVLRVGPAAFRPCSVFRLHGVLVYTKQWGHHICKRVLHTSSCHRVNIYVTCVTFVRWSRREIRRWRCGGCRLLARPSPSSTRCVACVATTTPCCSTPPRPRSPTRPGPTAPGLPTRPPVRASRKRASFEYMFFFFKLTRLPSKAKHPDGNWTRKSLVYGLSNNSDLRVTRPPEICF